VLWSRELRFGLCADPIEKSDPYSVVTIEHVARRLKTAAKQTMVGDVDERV